MTAIRKVENFRERYWSCYGPISVQRTTESFLQDLVTSWRIEIT